MLLCIIFYINLNVNSYLFSLIVLHISTFFKDFLGIKYSIQAFTYSILFSGFHKINEPIVQPEFPPEDKATPIHTCSGATTRKTYIIIKCQRAPVTINTFQDLSLARLLLHTKY